MALFQSKNELFQSKKELFGAKNVVNFKFWGMWDHLFILKNSMHPSCQVLGAAPAYTISEQKFTVWSCMEKWPRSILFMKLKWTKPKLIQGDCKLTWEASGLGLLVEFHDRIKNVKGGYYLLTYYIHSSWMWQLFFKKRIVRSGRTHIFHGWPVLSLYCWPSIKLTWLDYFTYLLLVPLCLKTW